MTFSRAAAVLAAAFLLCPAVAFAQGAVLQAGPVTPGHSAVWARNGIIRDGGIASGFVPLVGGTMTGPLILNADPTTGLQATTKQYTDSGDAQNATAAAAAQTTANTALSNAGTAQTTANAAQSAASAAQATATAADDAAGTAQTTANAAQAAANAAQSTASAAQATANAALPKAGGTMTGALTLAADPASSFQATTKQYTDAGDATNAAAAAAAQITANAALPKSGGTMTGTLTLAADPTQPLQAATKAYVDAGSPAASALNVGRNKIHNPMFTVAQRGAGPFTSAGYTLDRWLLNGVHSNGSMSVSQVALSDANRTAIGDQEAQFGYSYTFVGGTGAADTDVFAERIENVRRLADTTVTVSFWAFSASGTPKVGVSIDQNFGTGGSPSSAVLGTGQSFPISTTPVRYTATFTIPTVNGKTLGTDGNSNTQLNIWESSGATNATRAGNIGVQSGTVTVWGVQLEESATASPLEKRDPQVELALCQRFFQKSTVFLSSYGPTGTVIGTSVALPVTMRTNPSVVAVSGTNTNVGAVTMGAQTSSLVFIQAPITATGIGTINEIYTASADL